MSGANCRDLMPAPARVFVCKAEAAGIVIKVGAHRDADGLPLVSLHGTIAHFQSLPEMRKCRFPVRRGRLWLSCGIVGTLFRNGEQLTAVVESCRAISPGIRCACAQVARTDARFLVFLSRLLGPVSYGGLD